MCVQTVALLVWGARDLNLGEIPAFGCLVRGRKRLAMQIISPL